MCKYLRTIFAAVVIVFSISPYAQAVPSDLSNSTLARLVPDATPQELSQFQSVGRVQHRYGSSVQSNLAPSYDGRGELSSQLEQVHPNIGVEVLYGIDTPKRIDASDRRDLIILNILQSISTLSGVTYTPPGSDSPQTLYESAYAIAGPNDTARVPDPLSNSVPDHRRIYILENDTTFGQYRMQVDYFRSTTTLPDGKVASTIRMTMENVSPLHLLGFVPVIGPGQLRIEFVVVPLDGNLILYGNAAAKTFSLFVSHDHLYQMFVSRMDALHRWLASRLQDVAKRGEVASAKRREVAAR